MIVEFFNHGEGGSENTLNYFLGKKRDREYAKVLSGNEKEIAALIDTSPFEKKYTSGCLSFYEHDLSDDVKNKIMADFEKTLFPNMERDQYRILWIQHQDKINEQTNETRLELNFLIPNTEITTGKRLQPYYHRADCSRVDLFKKITNHEQNLYDPDDPLYQQPTTLKKKLPKETKDLKIAINAMAEEAVANNLITDRQSMTQWLTDMGFEVTREVKSSVSIKNPNGGKRPIRLEGLIYEQNFRVTAESESLTRKASEEYRRQAHLRYTRNLRKYGEYSERKGRELECKYRPLQPTNRSQRTKGFFSDRQYLFSNLNENQRQEGSNQRINYNEQGHYSSTTEQSRSRDYQQSSSIDNSAFRRAESSSRQLEPSTTETAPELTESSSELQRVERELIEVSKHTKSDSTNNSNFDLYSSSSSHNFDSLQQQGDLFKTRDECSTDRIQKASRHQSGLREIKRDIEQETSQINSDSKNEHRTAIIEHYRATARNAETSLRTHRSSTSDYSTARGIYEQSEAIQCQIGAGNSKSDYLTGYFRDIEAKFGEIVQRSDLNDLLETEFFNDGSRDSRAIYRKHHKQRIDEELLSVTRSRDQKISALNDRIGEQESLAESDRKRINEEVVEYYRETKQFIDSEEPTNQLRATVSDTFRQIGEEFRDRNSSSQLVGGKSTDFGTERDQKTDRAFSYGDFEREKRDCGLSQSFETFDRRNIFKALEMIEQKQQKVIEQKQQEKTQTNSFNFDM